MFTAGPIVPWNEGLKDWSGGWLGRWRMRESLARWLGRDGRVYTRYWWWTAKMEGLCFDRAGSCGWRGRWNRAFYFYWTQTRLHQHFLFLLDSNLAAPTNPNVTFRRLDAWGFRHGCQTTWFRAGIKLAGRAIYSPINSENWRGNWNHRWPSSSTRPTSIWCSLTFDFSYALLISSRWKLGRKIGRAIWMVFFYPLSFTMHKSKISRGSPLKIKWIVTSINQGKCWWIYLSNIHMKGTVSEIHPRL